MCFCYCKAKTVPCVFQIVDFLFCFNAVTSVLVVGLYQPQKRQKSYLILKLPTNYKNRCKRQYNRDGYDDYCTSSKELMHHKAKPSKNLKEVQKFTELNRYFHVSILCATSFSFSYMNSEYLSIRSNI